MTIDPKIHSIQPSYKIRVTNKNHSYKQIDFKNLIFIILHTFPNMFRFSCRNFWANTAATNILNAPRGVTSEAGAKA